MDAYDIIYKHYKQGEDLTQILIAHSEQVRDKALSVAGKVPHLNPDKAFIAQAAMLHDIGIYQTSSPKIGCHGHQPYICHGVIGRHLLEKYDLHAHALVSERHVGVGITIADIQSQQLPLPKRDMLPVTIEEMIICYADEFFSKRSRKEHSFETVVSKLKPHGEDKVHRFMTWHEMFNDHG